MKKKILAMLLMATLVLSVTACGGGKPEGELQFTVPEGFTYDSVDDAYYTEDFIANFNYATTHNDGSLRLATEEYMEGLLEESLSAEFGETIDISIDKWNDISVDGYDAIDYTMSYTASGFDIVQRQVIIDGTDNYHYVTFTELSDEGYGASFQECINSFYFND